MNDYKSITDFYNQKREQLLSDRDNKKITQGEYAEMLELLFNKERADIDEANKRSN